MQDSKTPMFLAILINIVNIVFSYLFVYEMGMKSDGVALGTLIAQYSGFIIGSFYFLKKYRSLSQFWILKTIWAMYS